MKGKFEIVMVDDDSDDLDFMNEAFKRIGHSGSFGMFQSSQELINYLKDIKQQNEYPSVVLLDHNLAGESGREIVMKLKEKKIEKQMTFIIFSSAISPAQEEQLKDVGVINCLTKPVTFDKYVEVANYLVDIAKKS